MLHRIAAGAIVIRDQRVLLVRYRDGDASYLVAPGGAIEDRESLSAAAEREVMEETGVSCHARGAVMIENLVTSRYQMIKVWYLCDYVDGEPSMTSGAHAEGIVEVGWFDEGQLAGETVYPEIIKTLGLTQLALLDVAIIDPGVRVAGF